MLWSSGDCEANIILLQRRWQGTSDRGGQVHMAIRRTSYMLHRVTFRVVHGELAVWRVILTGTFNSRRPNARDRIIVFPSIGAVRSSPHGWSMGVG